MIRSGFSCCAISSASCPSRAVRTVKPALRSLRDTTWRMCVSSSATRIFKVFFSLIARPSRSFQDSLFRQLQLEAEATAFAHVAFHKDPALVDALDDLLDQ